MKKIFTLLLSLCALMPFTPALASDPEVVREIDYSRYLGLWYEIGHLPNFFQGQCVRSTAEYGSLAEGRVSVKNTCYKRSGSTSVIEGQAFAPDANVPAKLKVDFGFFRLGDYWVIDLDSNYQWAVVSGPGKDSLFILARKAPMEQATLDGILSRLQAQGFDTSRIIYDIY